MRIGGVCLSCVLMGILGLAGGERAERIVLGAGVSGEEVTAIEEILDKPDAYAGKVVRVRGEIQAVCKNMGCWMDLRAGGGKIQVKVEDGVIVFPVSARGREAIAEGTVSVRNLSLSEYLEWLQHLAEENGESFDPGSVGEGPYRIIRVMGTGAIIL